MRIPADSGVAGVSGTGMKAGGIATEGVIGVRTDKRCLGAEIPRSRIQRRT